jgi:hypothetical protein
MLWRVLPQCVEGKATSSLAVPQPTAPTISSNQTEQAAAQEEEEEAAEEEESSEAEEEEEVEGGDSEDEEDEEVVEGGEVAKANGKGVQVRLGSAAQRAAA